MAHKLVAYKRFNIQWLIKFLKIQTNSSASAQSYPIALLAVIKMITQDLLKASDAGEASGILLCVEKQLIATKDIISSRKKEKFTYETLIPRCIGDKEQRELPCGNQPSNHCNNPHAINQDCSKPIMLKHLLVRMSARAKAYDKCREGKN